MASFARERERFPILKKFAYFETPGTGLIPDYVYEGVKKYQDDRYRIGGDSNWDGRGTLQMMEDTKALLAQMLHCGANDILFGLDCSHLFSIFTEGIEIRPQSNVVLVKDGWVGTRFAWQFHEKDGLEVRFTKHRQGEVRVEDIMALVDENTIAVSLSLVENTTGFRHDMEEIGSFCRQRGIAFAVDAAQAAGVMPIDVARMNIDFLVGNDYKWMMGYCGTGFAYIHPALLKTLMQRGAGWMSDAERFHSAKEHLQLREDAGRFELGYPNAPGIYALGLVAEHYLALGAEAVETYVLALMEHLHNRVQEIDGVSVWGRYKKKNASSITNLLLEPSLRVTNEKLMAQNVFIHLRDGTSLGLPEEQTVMRLGIHYFNNRDDVDRLLEAIKNCAAIS